MANSKTSRTRKRRISVPKDQLWFYHPEMQARIARAEEDFAAGRCTRTKTPEEAQAFLDGLKKKTN